MDTKLCRICGKLSENYVHIFKIEGLKNKIETCLPIIVSPHCLLPDTICSECLENVDNFYSFIKNCLQNIIVLEAQYDIMESCLKTKRKHEKGCFVDFSILKYDKNVQTDEDDYFLNSNTLLDCAELEKLSIALDNADQILNSLTKPSMTSSLVNYDESENEDGEIEKRDNMLDEISERRGLKRCSDTIHTNPTKIFKMDNFNKRKNRRPMKVESSLTFNNLEEMYNHTTTFNDYLKENKEANETIMLPQVCLICEAQLCGPAALAAHVYEIHGIDMAQITSSEPVLERKKRIPNLVKIADLKTKDCTRDTFEEPPTLQPTFVCPICPAVLTNRNDLFVHLKNKHPKQASLMCGLCSYVSDSYSNLSNHLTTCKQQHTILYQNICKICSYNDDNLKIIENHVAVHDFILDFCKKQLRMFDPCDYIEFNSNSEIKLLNCNECDVGGFTTFKEFSTHRRSQHQRFHCDLCNKFYGRNSHLWKHVNRLHKGHPSITCLLCHKTSASKYHLSQHFNKIHCTKPPKSKQSENHATNFMKQKFRGFDFQSVRQSFLKQELLQREEHKMSTGSDDGNSDGDDVANVEDMDFSEGNTNDLEETQKKSPPKEIDSSSNLYTNIITNYTPPRNEGTFKCPTCFKGFHKKMLLKKHKKNCRPRLQKDLLTRCKTCSRIFKDRQSLTKHLINYHSEYTCEICGQKVQSKCEIVSHIRFLHPNCHLFCHCGNILRNQVDLFEHNQDHRNSFVCQFCGDMLPTKIKLKMHILSLHRKILSLSCGICLKLFETQHILRDHVRLVHKDELSPMTSCVICGKNYGSKWKTYDHINKSHGRIFKACKICLEIFDTEEQLKVHFENTHINSSQSKVSVQVKKDILESEGELNDKMSSSELSNDHDVMNNFGSFEQILSENERLKIDSEILARETKISLLEKRLLGVKKSTIEQETYIPQEKLKKEQTFTLKSPKVELHEPSSSKCVKSKKPKTHDLDLEIEQNYNQNPLQNSSKRTVYVNSNDPSLCEICLKTWPAKKHLWQHYIRCHKTVAATVCGICLKTNDSYQSLQIHLLENHPNLLHGQGFGSNFICRICGRYHNASSKLKLHMAIHENFDWTILENCSSLEKPKIGTTNGYLNSEKHINYESLIEQVECSSNSDDSDVEVKDEVANTSSDDESNNESNSEDSLEPPTLTHFNPTENLQNETEHLIKDEIKMEYSSSESSSESNQSVSDSEGEQEPYGFSVQAKSSSEDDSSNFIKKENCLIENGIENVNIFLRKPEELDFAIRSISYEQVVDVDEQIRDDICEIQSHSLNPHELQSAVDSIL